MKANSTFVYITHDPNFAITRTNSKILWSKNIYIQTIGILKF